MQRYFTKNKLSASTNGRPIIVSATATPGTPIHTSDSLATTLDEVWLWATNTDTTDRKLTIEWGDPSNTIEYTVAAEDGLKLVIPGLLLSGGLTVKAFAALTNVIQIHGFVNRIAE